ncbi:MAG TPA: transcription termination factor NusA [Capsulimonadaceae bacterium]|jgi:N utilization substance protein A
MNADFIDALRQIEKEKDIPFDTLLRTLEMALGKAYKKHYNIPGDVIVHVDATKSAIKVFAEKTVVEKVENEYAEIAIAAARGKYNAGAQLGDLIKVEASPESWGRIAAQTARQVMMQDFRETERERVFEEYNTRIGEVDTGIVQRREGNSVYVNIGKLEALLPAQEQVPGEPYKFNDRLKVYLLEVRRTGRGPSVVVSRSHPSLIRRLFELEVPEIADATVQIKSVAREAGARSKIAVYAEDEKIDPVGACVGHRGGRVQAVVNELYDEKIDIIRWSPNVSQFVAEALSPAKVSSVNVNDDKKSCYVLVPDNQLSLAIGKSGQNVRLAARLTGWRIDIRSESQAARAIFQKAEDEVAAENVEGGEVVEDEPQNTVAMALPTGEAASIIPGTDGDEEEEDVVAYDEDVTITADMLRDDE